MKAIDAPSSIRWTTLWSRFVNRVRLRGRRRHLHKVARSRTLRQKIAEIAAQENGFARALGYLRKIDPLVFEELILTAIEEDNVQVRRNFRYTGDGGVDGEITYGGQRVLIQAKRYSSHIQRAHVQAFASVCAAHSALGLFLHTGRTGEGSRGAITEAGDRVQIVSGRRLIEFLTKPGCPRAHLDILIAEFLLAGEPHADHSQIVSGRRLIEFLTKPGCSRAHLDILIAEFLLAGELHADHSCTQNPERKQRWLGHP